MSSTPKKRPSVASAPDGLPGETLTRLRAAVDAHLEAAFPPDQPGGEVTAAMRAAVLSPGKRIRPVLALLVAETFGGRSDIALPAACSVELVHAASLALDDLPCMDDAELRRGRPALHRQFGEAIAILAAFALLARAQALLAGGLAAARVAPAHAAALGARMAEVVAAMCRGQALDLTIDRERTDLAALEAIHAQKTGALFELAAEIGALAGGARAAEIEAVLAWARNLGLAFQVGDDLLDVAGGSEQLGKQTGRDAALGRSTFVTVFGTAGATAIRDELIDAAVGGVGVLGQRGRPLAALAEIVRGRTS